jgi:hypothetical protein
VGRLHAAAEAMAWDVCGRVDDDADTRSVLVLTSDRKVQRYSQSKLLDQGEFFHNSASALTADTAGMDGTPETLNRTPTP